MPVFDTAKPRKLVWGATAVCLIALIVVYYMNNQPKEVPGYVAATTTATTPGTAQQSQ